MIELTKAFETGIPKIDEQHKELVNRINAVLNLGASSVTKDETEKTLKFLEEYAMKHFSDEEAIQVKCKYPKHDWHKQQHAGFMADIKKLKQEYLASGPTAKYTLELNNHMIQWIVKHIKTADREIGKYYQNS